MNKPFAKAQPVVTPDPLLASRNEVTLKLEPDAKINVTLLAADKASPRLSRELRGLFILVGIGLLWWFWMSWRYVWPTVETPQPILLNDASLAVAVTYPAYATYHDELELTLHITNRGGQEFTGNVSLVFVGDLPAFPLPGEAATVKLDQLAAGAALAHRMKFALRQPAPWWAGGRQLATQMRATNASVTFAPQTGPSIAVAPHGLPLRTMNVWLSNSLALAALAALLWEVVRKRFLGWEAKG